MYPEYLPIKEFSRYTNEHIFRSSLNLIQGFVESDYSVDMHVQEFVEINIVTKGTGMHYLENRKIAAQRGDVFIIPPNMSHGYVGGKGFDVYHFLVSDRFMEKYREDLRILPSFFILFNAEPLMRSRSSETLHLTLTEIQLQEIEPFLNAIRSYSKPQSPGDSIFCNSLALMLITSLCRIYTENAEARKNITQKTTPPSSEQIREDEAFMRALALIHQKYYEKISIAQLAKTAQLSRSTFLRKFQEVCHMPPARYLTQRRVEAAQRMLLNTGLPISEIAARTGFYDGAHFIRTFTAEMGISPGQYRKER